MGFNISSYNQQLFNSPSKFREDAPDLAIEGTVNYTSGTFSFYIGRGYESQQINVQVDSSGKWRYEVPYDYGIERFATRSQESNLTYLKFCSGFKYIDSMTHIDARSSALTSVDFNNINAQNLVATGDMFNGCSNLTSVDLRNWKTDSLNGTDAMFYNCRSLNSVNLGNFNTSNVESMSYMFYWCTSLNTFNLGHFNTSNVLYMDYLFYNIPDHSYLDLSNWDTRNVTVYTNFIYSSLPNTTTIDLKPSQWNPDILSMITQLGYNVRDVS